MSETNITAYLPQVKLKAMLDKAHGAVGRMNPYFLLEFYLSRVTCSATDLQIGIVADLMLKDDATVDMGGKVCVPANKFRDLVGALHPGSMVKLTGLPNHRLQIDCNDYSGVVACVDPDVHFPTMEVPDGNPDFCCYSEAIQAIHGACGHAISPNEGIINTLYLRAQNGSLLGVAMDGHRLSLAAKAIDAGGGEGLKPGVTVSSRALSKLNLLSPHFSEIRVRERMLSFEQPGITLIGRLLEGEYPDFRRMIPTTHPYCCVVNARDLIDRVERVRILAESDSVELDIQPAEFDGSDIQITAESTAGVCQDLVSAEVQGEAVKVRVAPRYLVEALRSLAKDSEDVVIKYAIDQSDTEMQPHLVLIPADHSAWDERLELIAPRRR